MSDFSAFITALSGADFEQRPVEIEEFVESEDWLSAGDEKYQLSKHQYDLVKAMTQIYYEDTLIDLHGEVEGKRRFDATCREVIMQLGKGSGKDFTSTIAVSYVVYLCLCLKSPTKYFKNASIDIINVAINADQAQRVFFKNFMKHIKTIPWFQGKYDDKRDSVEFDKSVNVYSGHSEREAYEGYNTLIIILDEISGFALENTSGNQKAKTGEEIYNWARGSVTSRFSETGKIVSLSFPRFKDDFIQQKYNEVVAEKEVIMRTETLKVVPNLPDGTPGNEFDITWEEDHITKYAFPFTFALRRPSWEVNPNKGLQKDYALDFFRNMGDALGRFACMPSNMESGFFKDTEKIDEAFVLQNGVDEDGVFLDRFQPKDNTRYFIHVDLAQKHDYCAVAIAHVDKWVKVSVGSDYSETHPFVVVDAVRYWKPTKEKTVDFADVRDFITSVRRKGFNIRLTTFDRWNSHDTMNILEKGGIKTETLSVDKKHYDDFLSVLYERRLLGPNIEILKDELKELRTVVKGQKVIIDHPRTGTKDLSDATCGAIYNAVMMTKKPENEEVEVHTWKDIARRNREAPEVDPDVFVSEGPIRAPKRKMPADIEEYMKSIKML